MGVSVNACFDSWENATNQHRESGGFDRKMLPVPLSEPWSSSFFRCHAADFLSEFLVNLIDRHISQQGFDAV